MIRREAGFSLIELLVAITVLLVGTVAAITAYDAARRLSSVAERQTSIAHRAQLELERVTSLPYSQVGLTANPATSTVRSDPGYYVTVPAGSCPGTPAGGAATYRPDHAPGGSTATEPVVVNGCSYGGATFTGGTVVRSQAWSDATSSGTVYDYITYATDRNCDGTICPAARDYKRVTVVVTISGVVQPTAPALVSTYIPDPSSIALGAPSNSHQNPLQSPSTQCSNDGGVTYVQCNTALSGTPITYFLSDAPYSGGYSTPSCSGNNLHSTLLGLLSTLTGSPDQLIGTPPSGACPTPPCFSLSPIGCGSTPGIPLVPATSGSSGTCGSPPADNTKTHVWVGPQVPVGTTVNLNGTGGMTAYLESASGVAVSATVCLRLYIVPGGLLGGVLGSLLSQPIGVAAQVQVTAQAGVPTPVSFNFNVGQAAAISSTVGNLARVEVVVWIAASANTNVALGYDQAQVASQVTLMST